MRHKIREQVMNPYRKSIESFKAYFNAILTFLEQQSKFSINLIALVSVVFIGCLDYVTGADIQVILFYLIPISIATWFAGTKNGILISIISAIATETADMLAGKVFPTHLYLFWDALVISGFFFVVVFILSALENTLGRYRTLIETSPDPIVMYSLDGKLLAANAQAAEAYGVSSVDEFFKEVKTVFDLFTEGDKAFAADNLRRTLMEGRPQKNEYLLRIHDGGVVPVEANSSVVRTVTGEPQAFISVIRNIADRKRAEEALEEERRRLQQALDEVRTLRGIVPICANCKKIRDDKGFWNQVEKYVGEHTEAEFSHGICPDCAKELYPELFVKEHPDGTARGT
jgi:PAS domain S-box-containing protein